MTQKDLDYFSSLSEQISALEICLYILEQDWKFNGITDKIRQKLLDLQEERDKLYN